MSPALPVARHGARSRRALAIVVAVSAFAALFGVSIGLATARPNAAASETDQHPPAPVAAAVVPVPEQSAVAATDNLCDLPSMSEALANHDVAAAIDAAGGPEQFRRAVSDPAHDCVSPDDPGQVWVVVNKARPLADQKWRPSDIASAPSYAQIDTALRAEATAALDALVVASRAEGGGDLALNSGFRSYETQVDSYDSQVEIQGQDAADHESARPGFSEHQTGLAADMVPCRPDCGTLEDIAGTPQGQWLAENSWRFGYIVRYEQGQTAITGYSAEPWHLRYIGVDLATLYHDGGYHTLEEFFGLPAAPDYVD